MRQTPETSRIELSDAPQIEGLIFRRSRGAEDRQLLATLGFQPAEEWVVYRKPLHENEMRIE